MNHMTVENSAGGDAKYKAWLKEVDAALGRISKVGFGIYDIADFDYASWEGEDPEVVAREALANELDSMGGLFDMSMFD